MTRPIELRAWIKPNYMDSGNDGEMVMHDSKSDFAMVSNGNGFGVVYDMETWLRDSEFEIMQYTGLKDKNGVKIFEGDIVEYLETDWISKSDNDKRSLDQYLSDISMKGVVVYEETEFCFAQNSAEGYKISFCHRSPHGFIKVIGNIHQNPELSKESN